MKRRRKNVMFLIVLNPVHLVADIWLYQTSCNKTEAMDVYVN